MGMDIMSGVLGSAIDAGLGIALANYNDTRQLAQQRNLQNIAIQGQQQMAEFNQGLAIDTWEKTGPVGQMQQLQKAGLNPGLMYGAANGGGGQAISANDGSISQGNAPVGGGEIQNMLGLQLLQAQTQKTKAETKAVDVHAAKEAGVDTAAVEAGISQTMANIKKIGQDTNNAEVQQGILEYEKQIKGIEATIADKTQTDVINTVGAQLESLHQTIQQQVTQNKISKETADQLITQAAQNTLEQQLRMGAIKAGIINTQAQTANTEQNTKVQKQEIDNMKQVVMNLEAEYSATKQGQEREWAKLSQKDKEIAIQKQLADFGTNDAAHIKQWTGIITDVIESIGISKYLKGAGANPAPAAGKAIRDRNGRTQPKGWTDVLK